jgi:hypothetical protein
MVVTRAAIPIPGVPGGARVPLLAGGVSMAVVVVMVALVDAGVRTAVRIDRGLGAEARPDPAVIDGVRGPAGPAGCLAPDGCAARRSSGSAGA